MSSAHSPEVALDSQLSMSPQVQSEPCIKMVTATAVRSTYLGSRQLKLPKRYSWHQYQAALAIENCSITASHAAYFSGARQSSECTHPPHHRHLPLQPHYVRTEPASLASFAAANRLHDRYPNILCLASPAGAVSGGRLPSDYTLRRPLPTCHRCDVCPPHTLKNVGARSF